MGQISVNDKIVIENLKNAKDSLCTITN